MLSGFLGNGTLGFTRMVALKSGRQRTADSDQAFNTCISFMVNCNLQHYSGESGLTYFTQLFVIMLFQFITAATGMAAMAGIMKSIAAKTTKTIGNFWQFLVISCTRILLPLSLIVGFILILQEPRWDLMVR